MNKLRIGCSGWSYTQWVGRFYPPKPEEFLKLYSKIFDAVEIDSTFYRVPETSTVTFWKNATPYDFLFYPKVSQIITHDLSVASIF